MNMFFTLLYTLAGLGVFIMAILLYAETNSQDHLCFMIGFVGVLVCIKGVLRMHKDN
jgi:uncharacterized membrane protein